MENVKSYKELIVWKKSVELVKNVYVLTKKFPEEEAFITVSQMRRAALSIPSNIAEGYGRDTRKEYAHFLSIAYASTLELETQLIISKDLDFAPEKTFETTEMLLVEVSKMLYAMRIKLTKRPTLNLYESRRSTLDPKP
jgi:four helix bundle protein